MWQNILVTIKINFTCQFGPWGAQMFVQIFCWMFLWRCFWMSLTLKSKDWLKPMALPNVMGLSQSAESLHATKVDSHLNKSFPGGTSIREPANAGDIRDMGSAPGSGRSPGEGHGNAFQYSCLGNLKDRREWGATVYKLAVSDMSERLSKHIRIRGSSFHLYFFPCLWTWTETVTLPGFWACQFQTRSKQSAFLDFYFANWRS